MNKKLLFLTAIAAVSMGQMQASMGCADMQNALTSMQSPAQAASILPFLAVSALKNQIIPLPQLQEAGIQTMLSVSFSTLYQQYQTAITDTTSVGASGSAYLANLNSYAGYFSELQLGNNVSLGALLSWAFSTGLLTTSYPTTMAVDANSVAQIRNLLYVIQYLIQGVSQNAAWVSNVEGAVGQLSSTQSITDDVKYISALFASIISTFFQNNNALAGWMLQNQWLTSLPATPTMQSVGQFLSLLDEFTQMLSANKFFARSVISVNGSLQNFGQQVITYGLQPAVSACEAAVA